MAQQLIMDFVSELGDVLELRDPIVEFGSMQVESGQPNDLRPLFAGRTFIGTDMREGAGVDRVEDLRALSFDDGEVGTALCLDTLEHCEDPLTAVREMHRVLGDGGICVITSVMFFVIHGYPNDYFRFTPEGFRSLLSPFDDVWGAGIGHPDIPVQVVGIGAKGRELGISLDDFPSLSAEQQRWESANGEVRIGPFRMAPREIGPTVARELARIARRRTAARVRRFF